MCLILVNFPMLTTVDSEIQTDSIYKYMLLFKNYSICVVRCMICFYLFLELPLHRKNSHLETYSRALPTENTSSLAYTCVDFPRILLQRPFHIYVLILRGTNELGK